MNTKIDEISIAELLADEIRPRVEHVDDNMLLVLRGASVTNKTTPGDMISIRMWLSKNLIISTRKRKYSVIEDLKDMLKLNKGPKDTGDFVSKLALLMCKRTEPVLEKLNDVIDDIEEEIIENGDSSIREAISAVRKEAIILHRHIAPQRAVVQQITLTQFSWLQDIHRRYFMEVDNNLTRHLEDLNAIRERAQIVKDELMNISSERLNKNMYIMSIITSIFLPLGFLTGLLGINVGGIPGTEDASAFWIIVGILTVIVAIQLFIFRKLRWL
jgi:zinc transporter